jgi:hypothetical protein
MVKWPYHILKKRIFQLEEYDRAYKAELEKQEREVKSKYSSGSSIPKSTGARIKKR